MEQIFDGLKLMLAGMGTVFTFLIVMILWIVLAAKISAKFQHLLPDEPVQAPPPPVPGGRPESQTGEENGRILAVISAAIHKYRSERQS